MKNIEMIQKLAVLQCIYQMIVSSDGNVLGSRDDGAINLALKELDLTTNFSWNMAIKIDPNEAFRQVSTINFSDKQKFKSLLAQIASMGGNTTFRKNCASQIFQLTGC